MREPNADRYWLLETKNDMRIEIGDAETAARIEQYMVDRPMGALVFDDAYGMRTVINRDNIGALWETTLASRDACREHIRVLAEQDHAWEEAHPKTWVE